MYRTRAYTHEDEFAAAVKNWAEKLAPDVVRIRYSLEEDWTGAPAVFFNVLMTDDAVTDKRIREATKKVKWAIRDGMEPLEEWGVHPYFHYRSVSEQEQAKEPSWA